MAASDLVLRNGLVDTGAGGFRRTDVAVSGGRIYLRGYNALYAVGAK